MCDDIIFEDLHLTIMARMDAKICDDLTYDVLNPSVCDNLVLGLMI